MQETKKPNSANKGTGTVSRQGFAIVRNLSERERWAFTKGSLRSIRFSALYNTSTAIYIAAEKFARFDADNLSWSVGVKHLP